MTFIFDYVRNTQTRDVIVAGAAAATYFCRITKTTESGRDFGFQSLRKKRGNDFNAAVKGDFLLQLYIFANRKRCRSDTF